MHQGKLVEGAPRVPQTNSGVKLHCPHLYFKWGDGGPSWFFRVRSPPPPSSPAPLHLTRSCEAAGSRTRRQPADRLQAPAVRAAHLEESWPAGEVEDGERRGTRLREQARQKQGQARDLGKNRECEEKRDHLLFLWVFLFLPFVSMFT
ncbi:hypothetical protein Q5P01_020756 [Channa striata]|uniref:Uncharacterized protein n=1 Tax=Channa striata TaxID=64152 RepID=A0AA88LXZ9_CHASR|nr:hypothetical protein Q5P01_020756 [Channa striata]